MENANFEKNIKCKVKELDEKSLEVLKLIDDSIERQYLGGFINSFDGIEDKSSNAYKAPEFSSSYQKRKKLLLEGRVDEVQRELAGKRTSKKWNKVVAAIVLFAICLGLLIGPIRIYAAIQGFWNAIIKVFTTHTELEFADSINKSVDGQFINIFGLISEDYLLTDSQTTESSNYTLFEDHDGFWISFHQSKRNTLAFHFDSENTEMSEYMVESVLVSKYKKKDKTTFIWVVDDMNYLLSGNSDESVIQDIVDKLIFALIGEN